MKIIKPQSLGILHKPYLFQGRHYFVVAAIGFFRLGADNPRFLSENLQWPHVIASLPAGQPLDEAMPKQQAEVLLLGSAYAPKQQPCTEMLVQLCVEDAAGAPSIAKALCVCGDREWRGGLLTAPTISKPKPFSSMPLDCRRAFGGPRHDGNPAGCGDSGALFGSRHGAMPNITYPQVADSTAWRRRVTAGFGPLAIDNAPRKKKWGTYNRAWLQNDAPGLARDIDWSIFNLAPSDQWAKQFFQGGEKYCLQHVHPQKALIEGRLPALQARAFIVQNTQTPEQATEVMLQMDTVWFLPEHDLGVVIYHGQTEIGDSDALDVKVLMIGYEDSGAPKSVAHYREVMALRLDKASATQHVFNDSQLAAGHSPAELARRAQAQEEAETAALAKSQQRLDLLDAQYWAKRGVAAPPDHVAPRAKLPVLGLMTAQTAVEGDFDLSDIMAKAKALAADAEEQGKAALAKLAPSPSPQPAVNPAQQLAAAIERAAVPAYDLLPEGETGCDPQLMHLLASLDSKKAAGGLDKPGQYEASRQAILKIPAVRRQGRRAAPKATLAALPLLPEVARQLGEQVAQWQQSGVCLAGRDFAGANLAGFDFSGADLREIMLEGADLSGATFIGANLQGAVLTGARLDAANFSSADLYQANLSTSQGESICFHHANLSYTHALSACWPKANLQGANLRRLLGIKLDLRGAILNDACADKATLMEIMADDSSWQRASLEKTVFLRASLQRSDFRAARLVKSVLNDAQLQESRWEDASLDHVQGGGGTNWSRACLAGVKATKCGFHGATFTHANFRAAQFLRCDFGSCDMQAADMAQSIFSHSTFFQSKLQTVCAQEAEFFQALCRKTDFTGADLLGARFAQCEMSESLGPDGKTERARRLA